MFGIKKIIKVIPIIFIYLLAFPVVITASASSNDNIDGLTVNNPDSLDTGYIGQLIWVVIALAIVIALLYFTVKFLAGRNRAWGSQRGLRSLGGIGLGQNTSLQIVEIANRIYIIGVGDQVTLLDKETDPEVVAQIIEHLEQSHSINPTFTSLKDWLKARRKKQENVENAEVTPEMWNQAQSFESLLQAKLDKQAERKQQIESLLNDKNK